MSEPKILTQLKARVLTLTLNRPEALNSIDLQLAIELCDIAEKAKDNSEIGAIIITGAGDKAFCAGGDLAAFQKYAPEMGAHLKQVTDYFHRSICLFSEMNAPVIAAINGVAAGGGLSMVGFPELAIASEKAEFVSAYTKIGLTPDGSSSYFLPRIIGMRRYHEMVFTNCRISAQKAENWGLVNQVVASEDLEQVAFETAQQIASGPPHAHKRIKQLVQHSFDSNLAAQLDREAIFLSQSADDREGQNGIAAFLDKKQPQFYQK